MSGGAKALTIRGNPLNLIKKVGSIGLNSNIFILTLSLNQTPLLSSKFSA